MLEVLLGHDVQLVNVIDGVSSLDDGLGRRWGSSRTCVVGWLRRQGFTWEKSTDVGREQEALNPHTLYVEYSIFSSDDHCFSHA